MKCLPALEARAEIEANVIDIGLESPILRESVADNFDVAVLLLDSLQLDLCRSQQRSRPQRRLYTLAERLGIVQLENHGERRNSLPGYDLISRLRLMSDDDPMIGSGLSE